MQNIWQLFGVSACLPSVQGNTQLKRLNRESGQLSFKFKFKLCRALETLAMIRNTSRCFTPLNITQKKSLFCFWISSFLHNILFVPVQFLDSSCFYHRSPFTSCLKDEGSVAEREWWYVCNMVHCLIDVCIMRFVGPASQWFVARTGPGFITRFLIRVIDTRFYRAKRSVARYCHDKLSVRPSVCR